MTLAEGGRSESIPPGDTHRNLRADEDLRQIDLPLGAFAGERRRLGLRDATGCHAWSNPIWL